LAARGIPVYVGRPIIEIRVLAVGWTLWIALALMTVGGDLGRKLSTVTANAPHHQGNARPSARRQIIQVPTLDEEDTP
jgi:hypothetical protein